MFRTTISTVAANLCCGLKSSILLSVIRQGQIIITKSVYSLPPEQCKTSRLCSGLLPNLVFTRSRGRKDRRPDPPTDYLPFPWERRKRFDQLANSGDTIRDLDVDPTLPRSDVELKDVLQDLDDNVRKQFSLETATIPDLREVNRQLILKKVQQHPMDFDSREVRIALSTLRIRALFMHCKRYPRQKVGKVMLVEAIQKRNKMLKLLRNVDMPRFEWIIKELNIEYAPSKLGDERSRYGRKGDIRRLTKEYCDKLISEKRAAYHAELKEQQKEFLKEKEEILAWIAEEEKNLEISKSDGSSAP